MPAFLERVSQYIYTHYKDNLSELCIVLPNRRAQLFLKNHLSIVYGKPVWAPKIFSIEDFIADLSGSDIMDNLSTAFEFYSVYSNIEKDKAQSVDEFLQWAPTLLHDFNEMDQYLVNADSLFAYLSEAHAISNWNLDGKPLTDFQKKYLSFWKSLATYYAAFVNHVKAKGLVYQGLAYRIVEAESVKLVQAKNWHKIIFAGFNALNTAEENIFKALAQAQLADILWDSDVYYAQDKNQEAGAFIRKFKKDFSSYNKEKKFLWEEDVLSTTPKKIVIAGVAQHIGQAKVAGEILNEISLQAETDFKSHALVLADENLLLPVLHSIPESVGKFNVTMGYSLANLSMNTFIDIIFNLHENAAKYGKSAYPDKVRFYYRDVKKIFLHPYLEVLLNASKETKAIDIARNFIRYLDSNNIVFISFAQIEKYFKEHAEEEFKLLKNILFPWNNNVPNCLLSLLKMIEDLKNQYSINERKIDSFELEVLFQYAKILKRLQSLLQETNSDNFKEVKTIRAVFTQLVKAQTIAFFGEPLQGLQVMGMLETRTLDFDTVILLSANEGVLPSGKKENSFIPLEIKKQFGLPTYSDKDAIFGYHFYRLLQRATTIYLIYNTETDEMGSGERSRYIAQLQHELKIKNPLVKIEEKLYSVPLNNSAASNKIEISKNDFVFEKLKLRLERGLSPSLLNSYRSCGLQFYFRYIASLKEMEEPEESIDAATFGIVIHKVLEECYTPFVGKVVDADALKKSFANSAEKVERAFRELYKSGELKEGKNLLNVKVAQRYILNFLKQELEFIAQAKKRGEYLTIQNLEQELTASIQIKNQSIMLKGTADRIDRVGNTVRIIDYKTGLVQDKELKIKEWDNLLSHEFNKSFQVLMYAYMYAKGKQEVGRNLQSGIISFRELSRGLKNVTVQGNDVIDEDTLLAFENELKELIDEILNPKTKFVQTDEIDICSYCSFKTICNR